MINIYRFLLLCYRSKSRSVDHGLAAPYDLDSLRSKVEGRFDSVERLSKGKNLMNSFFYIVCMRENFLVFVSKVCKFFFPKTSTIILKTLHRNHLTTYYNQLENKSHIFSSAKRDQNHILAIAFFCVLIPWQSDLLVFNILLANKIQIVELIVYLCCFVITFYWNSNTCGNVDTRSDNFTSSRRCNVIIPLWNTVMRLFCFFNKRRKQSKEIMKNSRILLETKFLQKVQVSQYRTL